jgi:hypothetical protein
MNEYVDQLMDEYIEQLMDEYRLWKKVSTIK